MGVIAQYAKSTDFVREAVAAGRDRWSQIFTNKETGREPRAEFPSVRSRNSWVRGVISEPAAYKRLLQAMRSSAPGSWSDDRWEQWRHLDGIQYVCFPPGTRVRMADGTHKPIENVCLRDEVVTAEGNTHRVSHCFVNKYAGDLVVMRLWGHRHLKMTPNHEVLTKRGYVPADMLVKGDWVAIPRYMPSTSNFLQTSSHIGSEVMWKDGEAVGRTNGKVRSYCRTVPDFIELNREFGIIVGLYLAEAHTTSDEVAWSFDAVKEKDTLVPQLVRLLEKYDFSPRVSKSYDKSVVSVSVCGKLWVRLFRSVCGKYAWTKRLHSDLLAGPKDFLAGVLEGWLAGDGCLEAGKYKVGATVSHDLALNMFDIGNALGLRPTILWSPPQLASICGRKVKSARPTWRVFFRALSDNYRVEMDDSHVWRKVEKIDREPYVGDVFNIEVETDQSYVAEGIGVHNCIHRTGEMLSEAEFQVYRKDENHQDGKRPVSKRRDPEAYRLVEVLERPNNDDSFGDMIYWWNQQMDLTGMALTWMVPNKMGRPYELYVIPTAIAIPQPAVNPDYPDGYYRIQPVYPYGPFSSYPTPATAVGAPIPAQWMLRFKYPHPLLRYDGYSPLSALRLHIDEITSMDRSRWYSMLRTFNPSAVLQFENLEGMQPLPEPEIERIRAEFENNFQGTENVGRLIVGTPGASLEEFGRSPKEMDYQQGWDQLVNFVMAGWGISKPAAGMVETSSYATLFATLKQFHLQTLSPKCNRFSNQLTRHLAPFYGDDLIVEVRTKRIDDHEIVFQKIDRVMSLKGMPPPVIKKILKLLDLPIDDELVAALAQAGAEGGMPGMPPGLPGIGGVPGMPGAPGAEQPGAAPGQAAPQPPPLAQQGGAEPDMQDPMATAGQPTPGKLGAGALGPRKALVARSSRRVVIHSKSLNGNGHAAMLNGRNGHARKEMIATTTRSYRDILRGGIKRRA